MQRGGKHIALIFISFYEGRVTTPTHIQNLKKNRIET